MAYNQVREMKLYGNDNMKGPVEIELSLYAL